MKMISLQNRLRKSFSSHRIVVALILFMGMTVVISCQKSEQTPEPKPPGPPPPALQAAPPSQEDIAWCDQFKPPWGDEVWQEWWEKNPEAGEKWFTETPKRMKTVDLTGLAKCTHLENMLVAFAPLKDLKPFKNLVRLKRLDIRFAIDVTDLSPLSGLHDLEFLGIWGTSASDLTPLVGLEKLKEINARMTKIEDLTPLTRMKNIERIDLLKTPVTDISPLARISRMTDIMTCSTQVKDLSPLYPVADRITYLDLCNVPFRDFPELKRFKNLKTLKLWGLPLGKIDWVSVFTQLEEIDLSGAEFESLAPLEGLTKLRKLHLIGTKTNPEEVAGIRKKFPKLEIITQLD